jgi:uncharacterized protein YyaL (SSP411 family)
MERESFENEDIAALMNDLFVNIKSTVKSGRISMRST